MLQTALLSAKNQIVIPKEARSRLNLAAGQELLLLCKDDYLVLLPKPKDFVATLAGLYRSTWDDIDPLDYQQQERQTWER